MYHNSLVPRGSFVYEAVDAIYILQYYTLASITFFYYDHLLTFPKEVSQIWGQKITFVSVLFIVNRYLPFFGYIPLIFFLFDSPTSDTASWCLCSRFAYFPGILNCISQVIIAILLLMRIYALCYGNKFILFVAGALGLSTIVSSAWSLSKLATNNFTFGTESVFMTCVPTTLTSSSAFKLSWLLSLSFDTVIFAVTIWKTYRLNKTHTAVGLKSQLAVLLMRDGSIFFAVMAMSNLINFLLFVLGADEANTFFEQSTGNNSVLTHAISVTMMSRLILNLRNLDDYAARNTSALTSGVRYSTWIAQAADTGPPIPFFAPFDDDDSDEESEMDSAHKDILANDLLKLPTPVGPEYPARTSQITETNSGHHFHVVLHDVNV